LPARVEGSMNVDQMISELRAERDAIVSAMAVLERMAESRGGRRRGRPPAWLAGLTAKKETMSDGPKRVVSAATKKKMALAQKKRWAAKKASEA
jgi:hypothetical protein